MSREHNSSQVNLFSASNIGPSQPSLFSSEEFRKSELLQYEKNSFGFYLLQNPLDKHTADLKELSNIGIDKGKKKNNLELDGMNVEQIEEIWQRIKL